PIPSTSHCSLSILRLLSLLRSRLNRAAATRLYIFIFQCYRPHRHLHSFPTRRSSDLPQRIHVIATGWESAASTAWRFHPTARGLDRKSTRLNSSHVEISYAVFCLKKKKLAPRESPHIGREQVPGEVAMRKHAGRTVAA